MVTGVETVGIVLGSIPLLLAALEFYGKGLQVATRFKRYRAGLTSLTNTLRAFIARYHNNTRLLLTGLVDASKIHDIIAKPGVELWNDSRFKKRLRQRLAPNDDAYFGVVEEVNRITNEFGRKLELDDLGKPKTVPPSMLTDLYKRLDFSLKNTFYSDLMRDFWQNISNMDSLLQYKQAKAAWGAMAETTSIPDYIAIGEKARGFHSALTSGWSCTCTEDHSVILRLDPRMEDVTNDEGNEEDSMRCPFHVLFWHHGGMPMQLSSVDASRKWVCEEAEVRVVPQNRVKPSRGVRFVQQAHSAVQAAIGPTANLQPIRDLCLAISQLREPQRNVCLSLLEREIAEQRYAVLIYPTHAPPSNIEQWSISSLRDLLRKGEALKRSQRIRFAVTLASSVLQLHDTPWLDEDWNTEKVYLVKRSGAKDYDDPFVFQGFHKETTFNPTASQISGLVPNRTLFALGVVLIELWYQKTIMELHKASDGLQNTGNEFQDVVTMLKTVNRLVDDLEDETGKSYSDAVRRCILCDFGTSTRSLRNPGFQEAVYKGVVAELQKNFDWLPGRRII